MKTRYVNVAVIGAGSAGLTAFREATKWPQDVVLIEGGPYGTTCARVGCMPSKLLIAAAEAAYAVQEAPAFGIEAGQVSIDSRAIMDRVRRERDRFVGFVVDSVEAIPETHRIRGYAKFVNDHELEIDGQTRVHAKRIVIATGSSPTWPPLLKDLGDRLVINDDIFNWTSLPRSVAVFGVGVIGLELGQALHRLGVDVRLFGVRGNVGPLSDPDVLGAAKDAFSDEFYLDPDANVLSVDRTDNGARVAYENKSGTREIADVDFVIAATGRTPNTAGLSLDNTTLPLDERGVPVFDAMTMRIGKSHVFIAGDVSNERVVLHEAADEGRIAGRNAAQYPRVRAHRRSSPLGIIFTDPGLAMVGQSYAELDGQDIVIGEASFEDQGRSRIMLRNQGLLRIYASAKSGLFLGAEMAGPRAEHIGHLLAWAHQSGMTISQMLDMPFYHPVIEEAIRTALRDTKSRLEKRVDQVA